MIKKTAIKIAAYVITIGSWSTGGAQEADVPLHYYPKEMYVWDTWYLQKGDPVATPDRFNCFEVPDVFEIDGKCYMITLPDDVSAKLLLRGETGTYNTSIDNAYALEIDPVRKEIVLHEEYQWNQRIALKSMPYDFTRGNPVLVELFLDGDILEVFIDKQRSLVHRLLKHPKGSLGLMVHDAEVTFEDLKIRTLPESAILPLPIPKQYY